MNDSIYKATSSDIDSKIKILDNDSSAAVALEEENIGYIMGEPNNQNQSLTTKIIKLAYTVIVPILLFYLIFKTIELEKNNEVLRGLVIKYQDSTEMLNRDILDASKLAESEYEELNEDNQKVEFLEESLEKVEKEKEEAESKREIIQNKYKKNNENLDIIAVDLKIKEHKLDKEALQIKHEKEAFEKKLKKFKEEQEKTMDEKSKFKVDFQGEGNIKYRQKESEKEKNLIENIVAPETVNVCVNFKVQSTNPRVASLFFINFLRNFGGYSNFVFENKQVYSYEVSKKLIETSPKIKALVDKGKKETCDPSWPKLGLISFKNYKGGGGISEKIARYYGKKESATFIGDELCTLKGYGNDPSIFALGRQYYSKKYKDLLWIPLGPRFEIPYISDIERQSDPLKRKYTVGFIGSKSTSERKVIADMFNTKKKSAKYKTLARSYVRIQHHWIRDHADESNMDGNKKDENKSPSEFRDFLLNSTFALALRGNNYETFRLWEAIEAGSIPIIEVGKNYNSNSQTTKSTCQGSFDKLLETNPPFLILNSWSELPTRLEKEFQNPEGIRDRHRRLLLWRKKFWTDLSKKIDCALFKDHERLVELHHEKDHRIDLSKIIENRCS